VIALLAVAWGQEPAEVVRQTTFVRRPLAGRPIADLRVGAQAADGTTPFLCAELTPVAWFGVEGCGTGAGILHQSDGFDMAHFRARVRALHREIKRSDVDLLVGAGFAEVQRGQDEAGFRFGRPAGSGRRRGRGRRDLAVGEGPVLHHARHLPGGRHQRGRGVDPGCSRGDGRRTRGAVRGRYDRARVLMLGTVAVLGLGWASELPLPDRTVGRPWVGGALDLSVGMGAWQLPTFSRGHPWSVPRMNVHSTLVGHLGGPWVVGLHAAGWALPGDNQGFRIEPRAGLRLASWSSARLDLVVGGAVDVTRNVEIGPLVASTLRVWPGGGPEPRFFLTVEARLAVRFSMWETMMACSSPCDQTTVYNPGGTGVLLGVGTSVR
jgi:hypothetical protein